uniref:Myelin protein zero-like 2b n=1 Tax=Sinocyclocheilus rhinocerous TaxID=307959 RepID=A0A673FRE4_9TELE
MYTRRCSSCRYLDAVFVICVFYISIYSVHQVEGIEVLTSSELEAVNGTDVRLKCTFKSTHPLSEESVSVSWSFRPLGKMSEESIFLYHGHAYPPQDGKFKDHAVWSGNVMKGDASITLQNVQSSFNGTYSCQVRNTPDFQGFAGEISLRVVQKGKSRCCDTCLKNHLLTLLNPYGSGGEG